MTNPSAVDAERKEVIHCREERKPSGNPRERETTRSSSFWIVISVALRQSLSDLPLPLEKNRAAVAAREKKNGASSKLSLSAQPYLIDLSISSTRVDLRVSLS